MAMLGAQSGFVNYAADAAEARPPVTLASAVGRVESINERLAQLAEQVSRIGDAIGGPYGLNSAMGGTSPATPAGVVGRLDEAADAAHRKIEQIAARLDSIGRQLG